MQLKRIIRVELYQLGDSINCVHMCYSPSDSVISIKQRLQLITGIPVLSQTLSKASYLLSDSTALHTLATHRNAIPTIHMQVPIRGGASNSDLPIAPFDFKDITRKECFEKCSFSSSAHGYNIIDTGINFEAQCSNQNCISVKENRRVDIQKGMYTKRGGYMSIRTELFKMVCPACGWEIPPENWTNLVFTDCTAEIEWVLADRCRTKGKLTLITGKGEFKQGKSNVGIISYHVLDVSLK